ncbi:MAG: tetratricopeptide repeat protein, partial [Synergistetes bacterium]|nr:tetratricopeptide repeat protein [Synergistota bacterium]
KIVISQRSARDISKLFNKGKKTESTKTVPSTSRRQDGNTSSSSTPKISPKNGIANTSDSIKVIDYFPVSFEIKENLKRIHKQWWWNYSHKRYRRSIKILKEAIKLYKGDYLAYYWIGEVYYEIGNKKSAIKYWKIGHEINPNYVPINRKLKKVGAL